MARRLAYLEDHTRAEWLALRSTGIGGSDAAAALGMSPWKSPWQLHHEKVGTVAGDDEQTEAMYWGSVIEPVVRARWRADHPQHDVDHSNIMYVHDDDDWKLANTDGLIDDDGVLEVKTANARVAYKFDDGNIPDDYLIQGVWYMHVLDRDYVVFAVLIGGNDYRVVRIERDYNVEELVCADVADFWADVQAGRPPDPIAGDNVALAYPFSRPSVVHLESIDLIDTIHEATGRRRTAEPDEAEAKNMLRALMGEHDTAMVDGRKVATWKTTKTGNRSLRMTKR